VTLRARGAPRECEGLPESGTSEQGSGQVQTLHQLCGITCLYAHSKSSGRGGGRAISGR
jgi:hypothetical protein